MVPTRHDAVFKQMAGTLQIRPARRGGAQALESVRSKSSVQIMLPTPVFFEIEHLKLKFIFGENRVWPQGTMSFRHPTQMWQVILKYSRISSIPDCRDQRTKRSVSGPIHSLIHALFEFSAYASSLTYTSLQL